MLKRDTRVTRKAELGRHLSVMDWPTLFSSHYWCKDRL